MDKNSFRVERDTLGEVKVPQQAYWGAETQRAIENFPIRGILFPGQFLRALGMIKMVSALANMELGLLDKDLEGAIFLAAKEVMDGKFNDH